MRHAMTGCIAALTLALIGCGSGERAEPDAVASTMTESLPAPVARAVAVARGIEADPAAAESVLAANGLTAAGLDSLMYTIAEDSALSAAYTRALR